MAIPSSEDPAGPTALPVRPAGGRPKRIVLTDIVPGGNPADAPAATLVVTPAAMPSRAADSPAPAPWVPGRVAPAPRGRPAVLVGTIVALGLLLFVGWLAIGAGNSAAACTVCGPVQEFPDQGHTHIRPGESHPAYNSDPPTSGWHREEFPQGGADQFFYDPPLDDEVTVHLMEHGMIIAWYHCPAEMDCSTIREGLVRTAQAVPRDAAYRLYVMARPSLPGRAVIALGAWSHLKYLAGFDQPSVDAFVQQFGARVRENMPAPAATPPPP